MLLDPAAFLSIKLRVSDTDVLKIDKEIQLPPPLNEMNIFQVRHGSRHCANTNPGRK